MSDRPGDRLEEIKALASEAPYRGDPNVAWLIAEVERLRGALEALVAATLISIGRLRRRLLKRRGRLRLRCLRGLPGDEKP